MMKILKNTTLFIALLMIVSCNNFGWKNIEEGNYKGTPYYIQEKEERSFTSATLHWRVKLGNLKPVELGFENTDRNPPYSTKIYGKTPFHYITDKDTIYTGRSYDFGSPNPSKTMLYLFSGKDETNQKYYEFFRDEWQNASARMSNDQESFKKFPHIIGVVFGNQKQFIKTYKSSIKNVDWEIKINPDGRINVQNEDGVETSGLSENVQMPGEKIYIVSDFEFSLNELNTFKNKSGKSITEDFNFIQK